MLVALGEGAWVGVIRVADVGGWTKLVSFSICFPVGGAVTIPIASLPTGRVRISGRARPMNKCAFCTDTPSMENEVKTSVVILVRLNKKMKVR